MDNRDYIKNDAYMNTSDPNIFAAGDVCTYPSIFTGERVN
jgi:thioredoxin reductase